MAQDIATSSYCSVIQVDEDISFVLDNRDINFALTIPTDQHIGISQKTYSKKYPIYNHVPALEDNVNGNSSNSTPKSRKSSLKNTPKCTSTASQKAKEIRKKRPLDTDESKIPIPRKIRRKDQEVPPNRVNGRFAKFAKSSQSIIVPSQDADIQILEVIERGSPKAVKRDSIGPFSKKEKNRDKLNDLQKKRNCKSFLGILKPCYPDVPTEADIAPVIPSNSVIPDTSVSETNQDVKMSNEWMVPVISNVYSVQNGEMHSAKESAVNSVDDSNLLETEVKIPQGRKFAGRELKSLYENLNEIYWAKEKNFKQMITISNTDHRHSDRITAKAVVEEKSLRRMKAGSAKPAITTKQKRALAKKNSAKLALNRAKYGRLKPQLVLKKDLKSKPSINKVNKIALTKQVSKPTKKLKVAVKSKKLQPKMVVKAMAAVGLKQKAVTQPKLKQKAVAELKQKESMPSSSKITKVAGIVSKNKLGNSSQVAGKSFVPSALKKVKTENTTQVISKSTSERKIVKKFEYSDEVKFLGKSFGDNKVYSTAMKKGSKLRVHVQPLEHTTLWNSDFCEAFSKYVIQQSSSQMETKNKESIKAMFEELMDSWYNSPPENSKLSKKKKPEEETLRSSVRQSEGAFRYKEIVVKKHENYMQFILVPNAVKQNCLSIEAMKELKDAFLLAKKDPNCRAVLFNSSGTFFCTGIDLSQLIGNNKKQLAEEMATTIMDLVLTLSMFTKPIIAAVNGTTVGFGITLLTLCDVVLASDKATFCIPATRLGYLPEGGLTYTLPPVTGSTVATELLLYGRRLTADQALRHGLVSEVLWHSNLMNEVVPRVQVIVSQPLQVMEATKTMVRCQLWDRLRQHLEREWRLQPPLWLHAQCQSNMKKALQTGWLMD